MIEITNIDGIDSILRRVWWETVKRQRDLVHLQVIAALENLLLNILIQAGKKASSKRSDSR